MRVIADKARWAGTYRGGFMRRNQNNTAPASMYKSPIEIRAATIKLKERKRLPVANTASESKPITPPITAIKAAGDGLPLGICIKERNRWAARIWRVRERGQTAKTKVVSMPNPAAKKRGRA